MIDTILETILISVGVFALGAIKLILILRENFRDDEQ